MGGVGEGPGRHSIMASPDPAALDRLGLLLAEGALQVPVQAGYRLEQAPEALGALATAHTQGKLAIDVSTLM